MNTRLVLFTANVQGGILQLTLQLYKTLREEGYDAKVFIPFETKNCDKSRIRKDDLFQYHKEKKIFDMTPYKKIASQIDKLDPEYIWYLDDSVICSDVGLYLKKSIKQLLTLHDAGTHHPTNSKSIRSVVLEKYTGIINKRFYKRVYRFVLLSSESVNTFGKLYPEFKEKARLMTLGAHLPETGENKPPEIKHEKDYLLFFGRIDKYKGISNLLKAYCNVSDEALPLVIAGGGQFTEEEKSLIGNCGNLTVINRYITDEEMKWLLHHMTAAVLPYIEATQSGVIPLSYLFGKPVLVSDVAGLTQFVIDHETGIICHSQQEWQSALKAFRPDSEFCKTKNIQEYYFKNMDWNNNVRELFSIL